MLLNLNQNFTQKNFQVGQLFLVFENVFTNRPEYQATIIINNLFYSHVASRGKKSFN